VDLNQYSVESNLTPTRAHTFSRNNGWWSGIVKSDDPYGNEKIRLYLWHDADGKDWDIIHKWNVQADRWGKEKAVVDKFVGEGISENTPYFPVQHYHVVGGETISKNDDWWTAVVQYKKDLSWSTHETRLYMWNFDGNKPKGTNFKWNIKRDTWYEQSRIADAFLGT